jgi:hypothetical protein
MAMSRDQKTLKVYGPDSPYTGHPDEIVSYQEGQRRVMLDLADFVNHGKAIRMRRVSSPPFLGAGRCGFAECNALWIEKHARGDCATIPPR